MSENPEGRTIDSKKASKSNIEESPEEKRKEQQYRDEEKVLSGFLFFCNDIGGVPIKVMVYYAAACPCHSCTILALRNSYVLLPSPIASALSMLPTISTKQ
jgi:hypothetical protein